MRWLLDTLHICVSKPDVPFVSIGDIPTELARIIFVETVINLGTSQMTVHFQTLPQNRWPMSLETEHPYDSLKEQLLDLEPGARVYERGNVTIDYLYGASFLLIHTTQRMLPLGPRCFSFAPFPQDTPIPVPLLLFAS